MVIFQDFNWPEVVKGQFLTFLTALVLMLVFHIYMCLSSMFVFLNTQKCDSIKHTGVQLKMEGDVNYVIAVTRLGFEGGAPS